MRISRDTVNRTVRTLAQGGVLNALVLLLRAFGVPITQEQQEAILGFAVALGAVVLVMNGVEDLTGKSLLKGGE